MIFTWLHLFRSFSPPPPTHLFLNTPMIKDKRVLSFLLLKLHKFFIITFRIDISAIYSYAINCILQKFLKFLNFWSFWKGNLANEMVKSLCSTHNNPVTPNFFNAVTSNTFQLMITSVFSLKLCKRDSR